MNYDLFGTICSIATPPGIGGVSIIRVSGPGALQISRKIARFLPEKVESHRVYFGVLREIEANDTIDEALVTYFVKGRSFTGEETVEFAVHGNPAICRRVLDELVKGGARLANRGEFTFRAFMSGRIDLVQAEAVHSLIGSRSELARKEALKQLSGELSQKILGLEKGLVGLLAHIEADIDFSMEGLETMSREEALRVVRGLKEGLEQLVRTYDKGRLVREGLRILLVGRPNAGKSSLLNLVLGEDRAIVDESPGTTRDVIEGWTEVAGIRVAWVDTAGLREEPGMIERRGIEKTLAEIERADLLFWVIDVQSQDLTPHETTLQSLKDRLARNSASVQIILNKIDLVERKRADEFEVTLREMILRETGADIFICRSNALSKETLTQIDMSVSAALGARGGASGAVISQARHHENLTVALAKVKDAELEIARGVSHEFVAVGLREALIKLQEVVGIRYDDQIVDRIFKEFCLGK